MLFLKEILGVGKTEILNLFSVILNTDSTQIHDILLLSKDFILNELLLETPTKLCHSKFKDYVWKISTKRRIYL